MELDLSRVPWSRRGARFALARSRDGRLVLKDVGGGDEIESVIFDIELLSGKAAVIPEIHARPEACELRPAAGPGIVRLAFETPSRLVLRCEGAGLRLVMRKTRYDHIDELGEGVWVAQSYLKDRKYRFSLGTSLSRVEAPWAGTGNKRVVIEIRDGESSIEEYAVLPAPAGFPEQASGAGESYADWTVGLPPVNRSFAAARDLAAYITWSCLVSPEGRLSREGMYMSKNWMTNVWSWDNCFNALALASRFPVLALDQLLLLADNQHQSGAYPDYVNDKFASFSCLKPPIHAWALNGVIARLPEGVAETLGASVAFLYDSIAGSTRFWLESMRLTSGALAYRHGNDSGWDNASIFLRGGPVESPDLYAHLSRQCDELARLARRLRKPEVEARAWELEAAALVDRLMERLWDGSGFFARFGPRGEPVTERGSLILRLPLRAAGRLPRAALRILIAELADEGRFLAPAGLATEALDSPRFLRDGYWLGPVWAPTSYLYIDALRDIGESGLARKIAARFLEDCRRSGMAENFDPLSGEGLADPAFTWTSSVFLLLAGDYPELVG